ncbi:MAG: DUF3800 domain-containing protein [Bacillati bacterium ANGP1]|uniref:DUF3800 domain-containing protein n=1 Tax=Candidatus Segetimicrobium genomatis TaxID=2569760 RepID=A0A537K1T3_9BACT|nr:MAG: DUF3800 domain-containing protein [Terrabacteria group bacterium ANGP1]
MRIYVDESGTHASSPWLVIGMLLVPDHGLLHSELCRVKEDRKYFNTSPKRKARYKETHLATFKSYRDRDVAMDWIRVFLASTCYFRSIVIDWSMWQGRFFGTPFEPDALKKRRAYKKWAEMLLHPETAKFRRAILYLDALHVLHDYDIVDHLRDRFTRNYEGIDPWIADFQTTDSWRDANQCLQLADLLTGCVYRTLVPSDERTDRGLYKAQTVEYLYEELRTVGVRDAAPSYWRGYHRNTLTKHFPKFSEWFWAPER